MTDADGPEFGRRGVLTAGAVTIATMLSHSKIAQAQTAAGAGQQQIAKTIAVDRQDDGVLLIGIDRVASGNVTDPPTFIALGHALYQLENDPGLKVGVLYGRGPNFCPGIDVPAWSQVPPGELFFPDATEFINPFSTVPPLRKKPLVVAVHGSTKYGGHELFLASDIRVAASDTVFSQGEASRALFPAGGATVRFVREAGWGNAMRYMLTGDEWSAEGSYRMGLLQAITPPGEQLKTAIEFAKKIAAAAPLGIRATLATARRALEGEASVYVTLLSEFGPLWRTQDFQERVRALRENRPPVYQGK